MGRPLRIEFPGAFYHVMSRGNGRAAVFLDDADREEFLRLVDRVSERLNWRLFAYCLMTNHYHLVLTTAEPTLVRGMRDLNGSYARRFNLRHDHVGHVFQARYRAISVERGGYLLELSRYVELNPVRAGLCSIPEEWPWSSHRALLGQAPGLVRLDRHGVLASFGPSAYHARIAYRQFVLAGIGGPPPLPDDGTEPAVPVFGSQDFKERVVQEASGKSAEVPHRQRAVRGLAAYLAESNSRDAAIRAAHASGHYSLVAIGRHFGLHYSTVSKICRDRSDVGSSRDGCN